MSVGAVESTVATAPRFSQRVGLLAGAGRFPFLFAEAARRRGVEVVCLGIRGDADSGLREVVDRFHWIGVARLGGMIRRFRKQRIECVVFAGKVHKAAMFAPWRIVRFLPDFRFVRAWVTNNRADNRDDSITRMIIDEFRKDGIRFASALEICPELLVNAGTLTRRKPSVKELRDVEFGWKLAKEIGRLDIGQSVAVKESAVLAIEAVEGTDQAILRAGQLCPAGGFTVVKVAKPQQDMRFDVPAVGEQTIQTMRQAGAKILAIEADRTILIDSERTLRMADTLGICVVALPNEAAPAQVPTDAA